MKRILFVDDETKVLDGLQRSLRSQRSEWQMLFAGGAEAAVDLLAKQPVDVIVTDMQMPGMDGAALLQHVHTHYPNVMRIILSGHFDLEAGMRAVPVAHQFLTKPCDPEALRRAIDSSHLGKAVPDEIAKRVASSIRSLPSLSATCATLIQAIEDPAAPIESISRIIEKDVALTAKVLQLANSAFFSTPRRLTNVQHCVAFLGAEVIRQLVMSAQILRTFQPARPIRGFSMEAFERHSGLTAKIAARIPAQTTIASLCAMTAILHDAGKLVLATRMPAEFEEAYALASQEKIPLFQAEQRVFGTDHAEVGALLLNLWGLPQPTVAAIAAHHRPVTGETPSQGLDLLAVTHIANGLAHVVSTPGERWESSGHLCMDYIRDLGVANRMDGWRIAADQCLR